MSEDLPCCFVDGNHPCVPAKAGTQPPTLVVRKPSTPSANSQGHGVWVPANFRRDDARRFNFQTAAVVFFTSPRHREQLLPSPCEAAGSRRAKLALRGRGWGVPQQTRCQRSELIDPPPPTPPHHAQRRVEGGEITVHDFAFSPRNSREFCYQFPCPPVRGRRECRAPDAPDSRVCNGSGRTHTR
jgi:hypothetical protein